MEKRVPCALEEGVDKMVLRAVRRGRDRKSRIALIFAELGLGRALSGRRTFMSWTYFEGSLVNLFSVSRSRVRNTRCCDVGRIELISEVSRYYPNRIFIKKCIHVVNTSDSRCVVSAGFEEHFKKTAAADSRTREVIFKRV